MFNHKSTASTALRRWSLLGSAAGVACVLTASAHAQAPIGATPPEVSVGAYTDPTPTTPTVNPQPPSARLGVQGLAQAIVFELPPIDELPLLNEDIARPEPLRIGVPRDVGVSLAQHPEAWFDVPGGRVWAVTVALDGAKAIRLGFTGVDMPAGAELWVYDTGDNAQVQGPFVGHGLNANGDMWTSDFLSDRVYVEYFVPTSAASTGSFEIRSAQHIYRSIVELMRNAWQTEGACLQDIMCFPAWHPLHNATVRITFVDAGTFLCSATLLNTTAVDQTPYLLTANHCISNQTVANTVNTLFFYQTVSCNGANSSFVQSNNCSFVITNGTVDITIMMQEGALPAGLTWAGWTTATNTNGTGVTCISHPGGQRKKYTAGTLISHPFGDPTHFYGISWSTGTIEGGSSGSGLLRNDNHLLIGVSSHSATPIDCSNPDGPSGYGKFNWFVNNVAGVATFLAAGTDDNLEQNDVCALAPSPADGTYTNRIVKRNDEDWYAFSLPNCQRFQMTLTHTNAWGDVDVELTDGCGGAVLASDLTNSGSKSFDYVNSSGVTKQLKLHVFMGSGDADTRNQYTLFVQRTVDPNCGCPLPTGFCAGAPNSYSTLGAYMGYSGTTFVSANNLVLQTYDIPPNKTCRYFYGMNTTVNVPFGNGFRCIQSFFRLPAITSDNVGFASFNLDLNNLPSGGQISIGESWGFQNWYRDPAGGGALFNSSDGLKFTFCP